MALDGKEFEVIASSVQEEVKKFGDNLKAISVENQKRYEELRSLMDENSDDVLAKEQIEKFTQDISTRQEELDKKQAEAAKSLHDRLDSMEVALKRPTGDKGPDEDSVTKKQAKQFYIEALGVNSTDGKGANYKRVKNMNIDVDKVNRYVDAFDEYLRTKENSLMDPDSLKALNVGSDPDGGYLVTPAMSTKIIEKLFETDPMRQLAAVETITTDAIEWLVDVNEAGADWETETVATTNETTPDWQKKRVQVHFLATRPKISQQMLEDSSINIESWLSRKVGDKFSRTEAASFVSGDGIGKPRGFLTYDSGTSWAQIEQTNMGAAATLTADGFVKVKYSMIEQYLERGTWLMSRTTLRDAMLLKDGNGNYIWKPTMIANDPYSTILNLPVRMSTTMPTIAANSLSIALGDWKEAYMIVDRLGITVQRDPYTAKPFVEFYYRKRVGGDVINYQAVKIGKVAV